MRNALIAGTLLLSACSAQTLAPAQRGQAERLAYAPAGEARDCVPLASIQQTRVLDDRTIDFVLAGGERVRNTLPLSCPGLGYDDGIGYSTSLSRLCSVDTFTVLDNIGGLRPGATCGLGRFQPVTRVPG